MGVRFSEAVIVNYEVIIITYKFNRIKNTSYMNYTNGMKILEKAALKQIRLLL